MEKETRRTREDRQLFTDGRALFGCALVAALLCGAQILGNQRLLLAVLFAFLLLAAWMCDLEKTLEFFLFFLPWSPLLKLYLGGFSCFTIALFLLGLLCFLKNDFLFSRDELVLAILIAAETLTAKATGGGGFSGSYLAFLFMLLFFPCIVRRSEEGADFFSLTVFFSCGIIAAALSAQQVAGFHNISQYINVNSYLTITRLSGYYGDANFYAAQIAAALAGALVLLSRERGRIRQIFLAILCMLLVYCGLLSASKSFIITGAALFFFWVIVLLERRNRSRRAQLFFGALGVGALLLSMTAFQNLLEIVNERFAYSANLNEITTGRTRLWSNYIHEFLQNPRLTFLGMGYTDFNLDGWGSHNTLLQAIYQFGIVGAPLVGLWLYVLLQKIVAHAAAAKIDWRCAALLVTGIALPWMGLDILFFDEFFLLPVYGALGIMYAAY